MDAEQFAGPQFYEWLALDIETTDGRPEHAERWMRMNWSPTPSWKDETIGKRYRELLEKKKQKLALLDESPIILVTLVSNENELRAIHCMYEHQPKNMFGALVEGFATQAEMLAALRNLLDAKVFNDTTIVGHNIKHFDLNKLRWANLRESLRLPVALQLKMPIYDTMLEYGRRFSLNRNPYIALDDVLELLEMDSHKKVMSGADVPDLYRAGKYDTIIQYGLLDVLDEAEVFLRMTGQSEHLK